MTLYRKGWGVKKDLIQAFAWISAAAAQGDRKPAISLDKIRKKLGRAEIEEAEKLGKVYRARFGNRNLSHISRKASST